MTNYLYPIIVFALYGLFFSCVALLLAKIFGPTNPTPAKSTTYECGIDTQGPTWVQFKSGYFLYALEFMIFGVEIIFIIAWAVAFSVLGIIEFSAMTIFILILLIGLWYAWKEGGLEWQ